MALSETVEAALHAAIEAAYALHDTSTPHADKDAAERAYKEAQQEYLRSVGAYSASIKKTC